MGHGLRVMALGALLCGPTASDAVTIIDQTFSPGIVTINARVGTDGAGNNFQVFQSFTVGLDGVLTGLDVYLDKWGSPTDDILVEIVLGSTPLGSPLAYATLGASAIPLMSPGFVSIDLSAAHLVVAAGDFLGFRLSSTQNFFQNANEYRLYGDDRGGYAGGSGSHIVNGTLSPNAGWDFYFRTYVCSHYPGGGVNDGCFPSGGDFPGSVPEPGTLALLGLGLAGLGLARRRQA